MVENNASQGMFNNNTIGGDVHINSMTQQICSSTDSSMPSINPRIIKNRDYTLIIDKSPSMNTPYLDPLLPPEERERNPRSRWETMEETTRSLVSLLQKFDPDGITVYVFSTYFQKYSNVKSEADIIGIFGNRPLGGDTRLDLVLKDALHNFETHKAEILARKTGETILVVTDGEATDKESVAQAIIEASHKIDKDEELAILLIQIGSDPQASKFLKELNDDLKSNRKAKFDIVAVKTYENIQNMQFEEVLLSAITE
jgi:hypothetical protein